MLHPIRGAQQPKLFAGKVHEEDAAVEPAFQRREQARKLQHARRPGGVIVGTGMDLPDLRRRQQTNAGEARNPPLEG